jgi:hypothetical protein
MNIITTNSKMYHGQADIDKWAKYGDSDAGIVTASLKQIKEAYQELMSDLLLESQEAY